jgi:hypothetical protein
VNASKPRAILGAILVCSAFLAQAGEAPAKPPAGGPPCGPPPEAFKACEGKAAGSRSAFANPDGGQVQGVCENDGEGKAVLRPDRPPGEKGGGHRGPPPEAYAACVGKAQGARAQFVNPRGEAVAGACDKEGERMVLRPDHPPPHGGEDRPPKEAGGNH